MPRIEHIEIFSSGPSIKLSDDEPYLDLDCEGHRIQTVGDRSIYDADINPSVQRPAISLCKDDKGSMLGLGIRISGIPPRTREKNQFVLTMVTPHGPWRTRLSMLTGNAVYFILPFVHEDENNENGRAPLCIWGQADFELSAAGDSSHLYIENESIMLELYVLRHPVPEYFSNGIPLLFLRMFLGSTRHTLVNLDQDWIRMVVQICFGLAKPETGVLVDVKDHWLRYDVRSGRCRFTEPRVPEMLSETTNHRHSGRFNLTAWLQAYSDSQKGRPPRLFNSYDQSAVVELAISLGLDQRRLEWQHRRGSSFLSSEVGLAGWGSYGNILADGSLLITDGDDSDRIYLQHHTFLLYHRQSVITSDTGNPDETTETLATVVEDQFVIDASVGPFFGLSPDDDKLPSTILSPGEKVQPTGSSSANSVYSFDGLLFENSNISFPDSTTFATSYSLPNQAVYGNISDLRTAFGRELAVLNPMCIDWDEVSIADVKFPNGSVRQEVKFYKSTGSALDHYSLRSTITSSPADAILVMRAQTAQLLLMSPLNSSDFTDETFEVVTNTSAAKLKAYMLHAKYVSLAAFQNVVLEIDGPDPGDVLRQLARNMVTVLSSFCFVDANKWRDLLV